MASDDLPVLPSQFFNDLSLTGHWSFHDDFQDAVEIGKGKDTIIYSAVCPKLKLGGRRVAVKVYDKSKVQSTKYRAIKREIAMMMYFVKKRLPSVVEYYGAFHDEAFLYIVMEHCSGGDLLERLLSDKKAMSERKVAVEVALPCLAVLKAMHEMRIIHRDIKLENIFIDDQGRVKLGDFGLTMSMRQESAISPVGTVEYMAPEVVALPPVDQVISGQIKATDIPPTNEKVDVWALGVTIYELVTGRLPFEGKDKSEIKRNITANNLAPLPTFLSPQCHDFIRSMLTYDVAERPSCAALLQHPYMAMHGAVLAPQLQATYMEVHSAAQQAAQQQQQMAPVKPLAAGVPAVISLHAYSPGAGGQAPQADVPRSPRWPGPQHHLPLAASRAAAGSQTHHNSPTILAQAGGDFTLRQDPFALPLHHQEQQAAAGADAVPRKISLFGSSGGKSRPASQGGWRAGGELGSGPGNYNASDAAGQARQSMPGRVRRSSSERKRGGTSMGVGMKSALRKLFTRRPTHQRLGEEGGDPRDSMQPSFTG